MAKPLQMTEHQRMAADPAQSVWVTANAGTGKTKVLTDRVLRLLLLGTHPEKILCLTYTRAAAAEMLGRLQKELASWVRLPQAELDTTLQSLTGQSPDDALRQRARRLFLEVLEAPEGVRMMTLHSLCQSLLKRFSLEAKVSPYFRLMEESQASLLLSEARHLLFTEPRLPKDIVDLTPSLQRLAARISEEELDKLMDSIISQRSKFEQWFRSEAGSKAVRQQVRQQLGTTETLDREAVLQRYYTQMSERLEELPAVISILQSGSKTDIERAESLDKWLTHWQQPNPSLPSDALLAEWVSCFLTQKHEPRSSLITKGPKEAAPHLAEWLQAEQEQIHALYQQLFAQEATDWSLAVLSLAEALLALYQKLKRDRGLLDYDDLIEDTHQLLQSEGIAPWILFKLDSGIDHLLVDEAQDTSPLQWRIIQLLAEEFFSGDSARELARTLFVVGDEKQSIYRFQGADPDEFAQMKQHFAQRIQHSGQNWQPVSLSLSFRSTPAVLKLVDAVFAEGLARDGVIEADLSLQHQPDRQLPGRVECWPPVSQEKEATERTPWQEPDSRNARENPTADVALAKQIAATIGGWLKQQRDLPARGRPVQPGDILILVRRRNPFYYRLIRNLKREGIPVAGEDRLQLLDQLAVQDVLALADFLLLPQDDLSLACVLKSPFFDMSEEDLFTLAHGRPGSLWQQVQQHQPQIAATLTEWLNAVDYLRPYELLAQILEAQGGREKLAARLGTQVHDPLNELLNLARDFEQLQPPSLQGFLQELRREDVTLKREMEQSGNQLRVMTVHSSKGLQAPIVILPDTMHKPRSQERLIWSGDKAVFFAPDDAAKCDVIVDLKEQRKAEEMREYRRLLYVALTRAADELYVCGWLDAKSKAPAEDCWYAHIAAAMRQLGTEQADGKWVLADEKYSSSCGLTTGSNNAANVDPAIKSQDDSIPSWAYQTMPQEPTPTRPLMPSRPKAMEPAFDSPLADRSSDSAQRGKLIHHLLEILPDIAPEHRQASAEILLKKYNIPADQSAAWIAEVLSILNDARFAPVFGPGSLAEVPVTAVLDDGQVLSGQIDRLVVLPDRVLIVDYKTNRTPPPSEAELSDYHHAQMQAYLDAIAPIYPDKPAEAAILWTQAPKLMPLALSPARTKLAS